MEVSCNWLKRIASGQGSRIARHMRKHLLASRGCHFGGLVLPCYALGNHFGTSGAPGRTMGAAAWTRGGPQHKNCIDFGLILGAYFESFLGNALQISIRFRACFWANSCIIDFLNKFRCPGLLRPDFRFGGNTNFPQKSFSWISASICNVFRRAWESFG